MQVNKPSNILVEKYRDEILSLLDKGQRNKAIMYVRLNFATGKNDATEIVNIIWREELGVEDPKKLSKKLERLYKQT